MDKKQSCNKQSCNKQSDNQRSDQEETVYDEFMKYLKMTDKYDAVMSYIDYLYNTYNEIYPIDKKNVFNSFKDVKMKDLKVIILFNTVLKNKNSNGYGVGLGGSSNGICMKLKGLNDELVRCGYKQFNKSLIGVNKNVMFMCVILVLCAEQTIKDKFTQLFNDFLEFVNSYKIVVLLNLSGNYEKIISDYSNVLEFKDKYNGVFDDINYTLEEIGYKKIDWNNTRK